MFIELNHDYFYNSKICTAPPPPPLFSFLFSFLFRDHSSLTVRVHKLECRVKRFLCWIEDHGLGEGSELQ